MQRNLVLDNLRGFSIFIMIITHALAYYLSNKFVFWAWDMIHFVVPIFVFVSTYLYFEKGHEITKKHFFEYFRKRALRLLVPYYVFLLLFFLFVWMFDGQKFNPSFIFSSVFLGNAVDIDWLVLLFLYLTVLSPLYLYFFKHKKLFFYIAFILSIASTFYFLFYSVSFDYKFIMWLPWSVVPLFTILFVNYRHKKLFVPFALVTAGVLFFVSRSTLSLTNHTLVLQYNKYPPDTYYLSNSLIWLLLLYYIFSLPLPVLIQRFLSFLSRYSYPLFFVHYLAIYYVSKLYPYYHWSWYKFLFVIMVSSIVIQFVLNKAKELNAHRYFLSTE